MSSSKIIVGIGGALVLLAMGFALREWMEARDSAAAVGRLEERIRAVTARNVALQQEREKRLAVKTERPPPAAQMTVQPQETAAMKEGAKADDPLTNPEARRLHFQKLAADLELNARPLLAKLGFSAGQWGKYKALVIEELEVEMDVAATARAHGLSNQEQEALLVQNATKARENLHALLGSDENYKQLIQWNQELALRNTAGELAGKLLYSDEPLTGQQAEQFVKMVTSSQGLQGRSGQEVVFIAAPAMAQLQTLLSPAQFAVLQQQQLAHRAALQIAALARK